MRTTIFNRMLQNTRIMAPKKSLANATPADPTDPWSKPRTRSGMPCGGARAWGTTSEFVWCVVLTIFAMSCDSPRKTTRDSSESEVLLWPRRRRGARGGLPCQFYILTLSYGRGAETNRDHQQLVEGRMLAAVSKQ